MNGLTRRDFLVASGSVLVGSALSGFKSLEDKLILGNGNHRYSCHHDWLTPPPGMLFGDTHGVAQDRHGNIYLAHTVHPDSKSDDTICVYNSRGKFLRSFGSQFKGGAHGLDLRREGGEEFLYHCDVNRRKFTKTKLDGTVLFELGAPEASGKYKNGEPFNPTNVAFAPDGDFFLADGYGSSWIHRYSSTGEYKSTFGGYGSEKGQVNCPHGVWLDTRGKEPLLAVADRGNRRIQYFDLDGKHVRFHTDGMRMPCHFSLRKGEMLVPDLESVITILDEDNKPIVQLGDGHPSSLRGRPKSEFINGKFIHPHDAMFLNNGDILVAEWVPVGRVTLLRRERN